MTEESHSNNQDDMSIDASSQDNSTQYIFGNVNAGTLQLFLVQNEQLLKLLAQTGKPESVGILKAGDNPKSLAYWQGRVEEIKQLRQWLTDENIRLIGIEGIGGTGKSMLATKIYELEEEKEKEEKIKQFPKRFWANVSSGAIIFSDLARRVLTDFGCGVPQEESEYLNALVRCLRSGQYLLVIDNLESLLQSDRKFSSQVYDDFFRTWLEYCGQSKILVTTRERPDLKGFNWLPLKGLKKEEGAKLLQELGIQGELEAFAELVDGHPLLLKIVADLIKDEFPQDPSLDRLADLGLGNLRELLTYPKVVGSHRRENVGMVLVLDASFEHLTDWQKIWLQNVSVYRGSFDWEAARAVLPQPSESYSPATEKREIEQELRKLLKRSLLEEKLNHNGQFAFQPVVLEYVRYKADKAGDQAQAHRRAIDYYDSKVVKEEDWQSIDDLKEYLEIFYHLSQLGEYARANEILSDCDDFLDFRGYYSSIIELNQQLVQNWQPKDDKEEKSFSWALARLGNAYKFLGQYQIAIKYHQQSLEIARKIGYRSGEGAFLGGLGNNYRKLGQYQIAIKYHQQSLEIAKEIGDRSGKSKALGNLGNAHHNLGQYQTAIEYHSKALDIAREIKDRSWEGNCLGNLGNVYYSLGEHKTAIKYQQESLDIAREIGVRSAEGNALGGLGLVYDNLGDYQTAIEYHSKALDIAREIKDRSREGASLCNLGNAYYSLAQYQKAINYYHQSLDIFREIGNRFEEGSALGGLGNAYCSLGEYQKAIEYHQQWLDIAKEIGDRSGESKALGNLGNAHHNLGQYQTAIEYHSKALDIAREIKDRSWEGGCLGNLGLGYNSLGQYQTAIKYLQQSLDIAREIGYRFLEAFACFSLGLALEKVKKESEAINAYYNARQLYEAMGLNAKVQDCNEAIKRLSPGF